MNIQTNQGDTFQDLTNLNQISLLSRACIYTIWTMNANDANQYTLLYIGQTGDAQTRIDKNHHKYQSWVNNAIRGLFVAFLPMPSSQYTSAQRLQTETALIQRYRPVCNG